MLTVVRRDVSSCERRVRTNWESRGIARVLFDVVVGVYRLDVVWTCDDVNCVGDCYDFVGVIGFKYFLIEWNSLF